MHVVSIAGAIAISLALVLPTALGHTGSVGPAVPELAEMPAIEASIAYKKKDAKQPQKQFRAPDPLVKPVGVSHDENKVVTPKPDEKDPKPNPVVDPKHPFVPPDRKAVDDDTPVGDPTQAVGAFDGDEFGVGDVTKGDPYFARLSRDLAWQPPELAKGTGEPVGCIQLTADGKIPQTKFKVDTDDDLGSLAQTALKGLQTKRNADPEPVPTHLLRDLTTKWICFKFTVAAS